MDKGMVDTVAAVLHSLVGFCALWYLFFCCWRPYRLESVRDRLFQIRYELFNLAERGEVSFEHAAYQLLRRQLNFRILKAHRITALALLAGPAPSKCNPRSAWLRVLADLPVEVQEKLRALESSMSRAIVKYMITKSPTTFVVALVVILLRSRKVGCGDRKTEVLADVVTTSLQVAEHVDREDTRELALVG